MWTERQAARRKFIRRNPNPPVPCVRKSKEGVQGVLMRWTSGLFVTIEGVSLTSCSPGSTSRLVPSSEPPCCRLVVGSLLASVSLSAGMDRARVRRCLGGRESQKEKGASLFVSYRGWRNPAARHPCSSRAPRKICFIDCKSYRSLRTSGYGSYISRNP